MYIKRYYCPFCDGLCHVSSMGGDSWLVCNSDERCWSVSPRGSDIESVYEKWWYWRKKAKKLESRREKYVKACMYFCIKSKGLIGGSYLLRGVKLVNHPKYEECFRKMTKSIGLSSLSDSVEEIAWHHSVVFEGEEKS